MKQKICIIGAGRIGCAIGYVLKNLGNEVLFWDKDGLRVPAQIDLAEAVSSADFLFLCSPSWAMREVLTSAVPHLNNDTIIISLVKGIEQKTNKSMDELLQEFLPLNRIAILGGAMLAEEIQKGLGGVGVVGTKSKVICEKVKSLFNGSDIYLECTSDMRGVALDGVLKNIYAIGLGIADGLEWGSNKKSQLVTQAVNEMATIIQALEGEKESAYGGAGLGDLVASGYSPYSRNRQVGNEIVKTGACCLESEGLKSLPVIAKIAQERNLLLPLLFVLEAIVINGQDAKSSFEKLFKETRT